jgi:rhodanese-related sulfurtransferase
MIYRTALRLIGRSSWAAPAEGADPLIALAADVAARTPAVEHMNPGVLAALLTLETRRIMLFDVREPREYAVGHLANAVLVPPRARDTLRGVQDALSCRPETELAVFYCAVGVRSSAVAALFCRTSERDGARSSLRIANLAGGLFRWANEDRAMLNAHGETKNVHPFNRHWGQFLLTSQTRLARAPAANAADV